MKIRICGINSLIIIGAVDRERCVEGLDWRVVGGAGGE
jgi:hypothetical protein